MNQLPPALAPLAQYPQFIAYRLVPSTTRPGKTDKKPISIHTGWTADPTDPNTWASFEQAAAFVAAGEADGVGFVFTEQAGLWFIDIDDCLQNGQWSALAQDLMNRTAGAAIEVSSSGNGLHIIGAGKAPDHGCKNTALGLEFYTEGRFVALTGHQATGNAVADLSHALPALVADYFPPGAGGSTDADEWTTAPVPEWDGHTDDNELIRHALSTSGGAAKAFGTGRKATFADLWNGNEQALAEAYPDPGGQGRPYGESEADAALAQHLAFWTGKDCGRMFGLMWLSSLAREKWEARADYLPRTIMRACAMQQDVHQRRRSEPDAPTAPLGLKFEASRETECFLSARVSRIVFFNGMWLTWEAGGYYRELEDDALKRDVRAACGWRLSKTAVSNTLDELKAALIVEAHGITLPHWIERESGMPPAADLIVCNNGVLDPVTRRLYPHSDQLLTLNALPFDYQPDSPDPHRWLAFLEEVFPDEQSRSELQKLAGYLLTQDTGLQKIFAIIGPKRSGKGTIARVLRGLLGQDNVAGPSFTQMGQEFGLASLIGKQLAVFTDARIGRTTDKAVVAERLLSISGEDAIDVPRKHRNNWHGKLAARLLIISNEIPTIGDASGALSSRFVVFHTPRSFYGNEDPQLTNKLMSELPGIMNWALEGLARLRSEGRIVTPDAANELREEMDTIGSPIKGFVQEACVVGSGLVVEKTELFNAYTRWHAAEGIPGRPFSKEVFGRHLKTAFPGEISSSRPRLSGPGERPRCWTGLTLTDNYRTGVSVSTAFGPGSGP